RLDRVLVYLERVGAVLEVIGDALDGRGQLLGFADGDKAGVQPIRERRTEDETTGLDADDEVDLLLDVVLAERVDQGGETAFVAQQGGDVVEEDALLREVRDFADELLERLAVDGACCLLRDAKSTSLD